MSVAQHSPIPMTPVRLHIIRGILSDKEDMPRKYQNPKLEKRTDVARPFYFIRISVVKITESGRKRKREVRFIGYVDKISAKEANRIRAEVLEVVNEGRALIQSQMRFKDVAKRFLDIRVPQLGFATQKKYKTQIEKHILPAFGELRMCELEASAVESWLHEKEKSGLGWWTRIDLKGVLSAIFTAAKGWKLWEGNNPTEGVRIGRKRLVREKRLLNAAQLRLVLAALADRPKFIVLIIFGLGLRISEVLGLRWSDIDFEAKTISISRRWHRGNLGEEFETKSEASTATMQLGPSMLQEFNERFPGHHKRAEFIFVSNDGHVPPDDRDLLREEFRPVVKRLGLYYKGFGWHAFRRQNITWLQTVGDAKPLEAMKLARHSSIDMTLLYTLKDAERETAQQQAMFDELMKMPEGPKQ